MSTPSISSVVGKVVHGVVTVWDDVVHEVESAEHAITQTVPASALPGLQAEVTAVKQAASDVLGMLANGAGDAEKALASAIEMALNAYVATATNGAAVPLVPFVDKGIDAAGTLAVGVVRSYLLGLKGKLAANPQLPAPAAA